MKRRILEAPCEPQAEVLNYCTGSCFELTSEAAIDLTALKHNCSKHPSLEFATLGCEPPRVRAFPLSLHQSTVTRVAWSSWGSMTNTEGDASPRLSAD